MKNICLIVLFTLSVNCLGYSQWFDPGTVYYYDFVRFASVGVTSLQSLGDTIIAGDEVLKVSYSRKGENQETGKDFGSDNYFERYLIKVKDSLVLYSMSNDISFDTLVDFSRNVSDRWQVYHDTINESKDIFCTIIEKGNSSGLPWLRVVYDSECFAPPGEMDTIYWGIGNVNHYMFINDFCEEGTDGGIGGPLRCVVDSSGNQFKRTEDENCEYDFRINTNDVYPAEIEIYPNPVSNVLNLEIGNLNQIKNKVNIYSLSGKWVESYFIDRNQIDVSSLDSGIYFLQLTDDTGIHMVKMVKL